MIDIRSFIGTPLQFKNICKIYPPTVNDVFGEKEGYKFISLLTQTQDEVIELLQQANTNYEGKFPTPFEFILITAYSSSNSAKFVNDAIRFFVHEDVYCLPDQKLIYIGKKEDISNIQRIEDAPCLTDDNFLDFQNCIRMSLGFPIETEIPLEEETNPIIRRVKEATRRRERAAKQNKKGKGIGTDVTLVALCCMEMGLNPLNIGQLPYASIKPLISMYQAKERYNIDVRTIQAGGDPKKIHPKYWIKDSSDNANVQVSSGSNGDIKKM